MVERIGNCRILGEIGSGGMAVVYEAIQEPLNRRVAIKALKPSIAIDSQFAERFEREANFMATLQHENILHVIDFVKDGTSMYIVMEYVDGLDLYDLLERVDRVPPDIAALIALKVARGLDHAHFRGIIHRDIKPANVMISTEGEVKLMDFGIARHERLGDLTETGTGLGTPSYMSPEQILGDHLDFRSDIFSTGILLYQMLTGRKPFVDDEARTVMHKIRTQLHESPKRLGINVPKKLDRILVRCLQKQRSARYASTQALIDDLRDFLAPRVRVNHNARLVLYLRDADVITQAQADEVLANGVLRNATTGADDKRFLKRMMKTQGVALAVMAALGLVVQASRGSGLESQQANIDHAQSGYLRVHANPWAHVFVDGVQVATTPFANGIALPPGEHFVKFVHPSLGEVEEKFEIIAGKTVVRQVTLERPSTASQLPTETTP